MEKVHTHPSKCINKGNEIATKNWVDDNYISKDSELELVETIENIKESIKDIPTDISQEFNDIKDKLAAALGGIEDLEDIIANQVSSLYHAGDSGNATVERGGGPVQLARLTDNQGVHNIIGDSGYGNPAFDVKFKTINGESIFADKDSDNIEIEGSGTGIDPDAIKDVKVDGASVVDTNKVANISTDAIANKIKEDVSSEITTTVENNVKAAVNKDIRDLLDSKVDNEANKGLSTNDFNDGYKDTLDNIISNLDDYKNRVNGVKVGDREFTPDLDGFITIAVDSEGNISNTKLSDFEDDLSEEDGTLKHEHSLYITKDEIGGTIESMVTSELGKKEVVQEVKVDGLKVSFGGVANIGLNKKQDKLYGYTETNTSNALKPTVANIEVQGRYTETSPNEKYGTKVTVDDDEFKLDFNKITKLTVNPSPNYLPSVGGGNGSYGDSAESITPNPNLPSSESATPLGNVIINKTGAYIKASSESYTPYEGYKKVLTENSLKTINSQSLIGTGDIKIEGGDEILKLGEWAFELKYIDIFITSFRNNNSFNISLINLEVEKSVNVIKDSFYFLILHPSDIPRSLNYYFIIKASEDSNKANPSLKGNVVWYSYPTNIPDSLHTYIYDRVYGKQPVVGALNYIKLIDDRVENLENCCENIVNTLNSMFTYNDTTKELKISYEDLPNLGSQSSTLSVLNSKVLKNISFSESTSLLTYNTSLLQNSTSSVEIPLYGTTEDGYKVSLGKIKVPTLHLLVSEYKGVETFEVNSKDFILPEELSNYDTNNIESLSNKLKVNVNKSQNFVETDIMYAFEKNEARDISGADFYSLAHKEKTLERYEYNGTLKIPVYRYIKKLVKSTKGDYNVYVYNYYDEYKVCEHKIKWDNMPHYGDSYGIIQRASASDSSSDDFYELKRNFEKTNDMRLQTFLEYTITSGIYSDRVYSNYDLLFDDSSGEYKIISQKYEELIIEYDKSLNIGKTSDVIIDLKFKARNKTSESDYTDLFISCNLTKLFDYQKELKRKIRSISTDGRTDICYISSYEILCNPEDSTLLSHYNNDDYSGIFEILDLSTIEYLKKTSITQDNPNGTDHPDELQLNGIHGYSIQIRWKSPSIKLYPCMYPIHQSTIPDIIKNYASQLLTINGNGYLVLGSEEFPYDWVAGTLTDANNKLPVITRPVYFLGEYENGFIGNGEKDSFKSISLKAKKEFSKDSPVLLFFGSLIYNNENYYFSLWVINHKYTDDRIIPSFKATSEGLLLGPDNVKVMETSAIPLLKNGYFIKSTEHFADIWLYKYNATNKTFTRNLSKIKLLFANYTGDSIYNRYTMQTSNKEISEGNFNRIELNSTLNADENAFPLNTPNVLYMFFTDEEDCFKYYIGSELLCKYLIYNYENKDIDVQLVENIDVKGVDYGVWPYIKKTGSESFTYIPVNKLLNTTDINIFKNKGYSYNNSAKIGFMLLAKVAYVNTLSVPPDGTYSKGLFIRNTTEDSKYSINYDTCNKVNINGEDYNMYLVYPTTDFSFGIVTEYE